MRSMCGCRSALAAEPFCGRGRVEGSGDATEGVGDVQHVFVGQEEVCGEPHVAPLARRHHSLPPQLCHHSLGVAVPAVRASYLREFETDSRPITAAFLGDPSGTVFSVPGEEADASYFNLLFSVPFSNACILFRA